MIETWINSFSRGNNKVHEACVPSVSLCPLKLPFLSLVIPVLIHFSMHAYVLGIITTCKLKIPIPCWRIKSRQYLSPDCCSHSAPFSIHNTCAEAFTAMPTKEFSHLILCLQLMEGWDVMVVLWSFKPGTYQTGSCRTYAEASNLRHAVP
jgi:hypothetical protein